VVQINSFRIEAKITVINLTLNSSFILANFNENRSILHLTYYFKGEIVNGDNHRFIEKGLFPFAFAFGREWKDVRFDSREF